MTPVDEQKLWATDDASVWASEFKKVVPEVDEGLMIGWFANAMETAKTLARDDAIVERDRFRDALRRVGLFVRQ